MFPLDQSLTSLATIGEYSPREDQAIVSEDTNIDKKLVILVRGLPSAGKTTMANCLAKLLQAPRVNADDIRANISTDLGFTIIDRLTQARRMAHISLLVASGRNSIVVTDFVCPTQATYDAFKSKVDEAGAILFTVWMDTIKESPYSNTNAIFDTSVTYSISIGRFETPAELLVNANTVVAEVNKLLDIREYYLRYNTQCGSSGLRWRIIDASTNTEQLAETFSTHGALTMPQMTVEHDVEKWNVGFRARAVWAGNHVDFY